MLLKAPLVYEFAPRQPDRQTDEQQYMTVGSCFLSTFLCMGSRHSLLVLPHRPGGDQRGALPYLYPARLPWRPTAAKLKRAPAPPAPPTSSSHVPLRTQALRKPLSLKDKSFQKKTVGPCGAGRRSARSKTFQPVNATYVALTRRTAPRWPPGQKTFPARGAYAPSRERGSPLPLPLQGREGTPVGARFGCQIRVARRFVVRNRDHDGICSEALIEKHVRLRCHDFVGGARTRCSRIITMVPHMVLRAYKRCVMPTAISTAMNDHAAELEGRIPIQGQEHFEVHRREIFSGRLRARIKYQRFK